MAQVIVTGNGFAADAPGWRFLEPAALAAHREERRLAVDLRADAALAPLLPQLDSIAMIRITLAAFGDGRAFSLGRQLRAAGYRGRLRARGALLPDQFGPLRACGFDEAEISAARAARQPAEQWLRAIDDWTGAAPFNSWRNT